MKRNFFSVCVILVIVTVESSPLQRAINFPSEVPTGSEMDEELQRQKVKIGNNIVTEQIENEKPLNPGASQTSTINQSANALANFLQPFIQRLQFSPQAFFQDRLGELKEALKNWKKVTTVQDLRSARQYGGTNSLFHLTGFDDHGFYTDRLEPAGFFGGNGWFANKGGLLGGPGAILSTGSILTDYPTPY